MPIPKKLCLTFGRSSLFWLATWVLGSLYRYAACKTINEWIIDNLNRRTDNKSKFDGVILANLFLPLILLTWRFFNVLAEDKNTHTHTQRHRVSVVLLSFVKIFIFYLLPIVSVCHFSVSLSPPAFLIIILYYFRFITRSFDFYFNPV